MRKAHRRRDEVLHRLSQSGAPSGVGAGRRGWSDEGVAGIPPFHRTSLKFSPA